MNINRRNLLASGTVAAAGPVLSARCIAKETGNDTKKYDARSASPEYSIGSDGAVRLNLGQAISNVSCFGCTTQCGVRVRVDKKTESVIRVAGNPYHPLATCRHLPMKASVRESLTAMSAYGDRGQLLRPALCGRGNAMLEMMTSPRRILSPLKRVGPRNSGKWKTISFEQLVKEVVYGGNLFGEGHVEGLKALRDTATPIDPSAPELGPRVNQVGVMMCTNEGRDGFSRRFWNRSYGTLNYVGHGSWCGGSYRSGSAAVFGNMKQMAHGKPDFENAEFILFMGTSPGQAGNPFKRTAEIVAEGRASGRLSYVVVDPVMTNSSNLASGDRAKWLPILPGTDGALVMGMIRWMIENHRVNEGYLACPNLRCAEQKGHPSFSAASWLVVADPKHPKFGLYLRAADIGLASKSDQAGVVFLEEGKAAASDECMDPVLLDVSATVEIEGKPVSVKSAFRLLKEESLRQTVGEYAAACGVSPEDITGLAREFTSHGVKASAIAHGGMMSGSGFFNAFSIITLNVLIGNLNCRGGFVMNGGGFKDAGPGPRYDLQAFEGSVKPKGIPIGRNVPYGRTSEFKAKKAAGSPFPAADAWFPNAPGLGTEWFASLASQYPYGLKALVLWMCNPVYGMPGVRPAVEATLADPAKLPLIISIDCFFNESNAFADYIVPDTHMYETWGWVAPWNGVPTKTMASRWPVVEPKTARSADGKAVSMETFVIALAKEMGLPGFGKNVLKDKDGNLLDLESPEDWYLRGGANIAFAGGKPVAEATDEDMEITGVDRLRSRLEKTLKPDEWRRVAALYTRGGRFEPHAGMTDAGHPEWMNHRFKLPLYLWNEKVGSAKNALTGRRDPGCATWQEPAFADGSPMRKHFPKARWPFLLMSYKSVIHSSYSLDTSLSALKNDNPVYIHPEDAAGLNLKSGASVRISTPGGSVDATVMIDPGVARGVVAIEHGYGHRDLGARAVTVNGKEIPSHRLAGKGVNINDIGLLDPTRRGKAMWVNPISGACVRNGLPAKVEVIA